MRRKPARRGLAPEKPPTPRELAGQAALSALKEGSLYRVARAYAAEHAPVSMRDLLGRGRRHPQAVRSSCFCGCSVREWDAAARSCGVHRSTIFRSRKMVTSGNPAAPPLLRVNSGHMPDIDPKKHVRPSNSPAKSMSDLSHDMSVSEGYLHRLLRTGAWTPQQRTNLRQALGDQAWRFVCGDGDYRMSQHPG